MSAHAGAVVPELIFRKLEAKVHHLRLQAMVTVSSVSIDSNSEQKESRTSLS